MLRDAACGKQDRGQTGASMPDWKRGSGLGDRLHGGEVAEEGEFDPVEENYKPIATGPHAPKSTRRTSDEREAQEESRE